MSIKNKSTNTFQPDILDPTEKNSPPPTPRRELPIRRRHPIRPTSRRERAKPPTLPAANHIPPRSQPPDQASSHQGRHLSWHYAAPQPKRTGRRQKVRFLATDAFGRPGPGRSPGRSLPSFCRHRKKGPAGQAVEETTGKLQKRGGEEREPKGKSPKFKKRPAACLEGKAPQRERKTLPRLRKIKVSFRPPCLSLREKPPIIR